MKSKQLICFLTSTFLFKRNLPAHLNTFLVRVIRFSNTHLTVHSFLFLRRNKAQQELHTHNKASVWSTVGFKREQGESWCGQVAGRLWGTWTWFRWISNMRLHCKLWNKNSRCLPGALHPWPETTAGWRPPKSHLLVQTRGTEKRGIMGCASRGKVGGRRERSRPIVSFLRGRSWRVMAQMVLIAVGMECLRLGRREMEREVEWWGDVVAGREAGGRAGSRWGSSIGLQS